MCQQRRRIPGEVVGFFSERVPEDLLLLPKEDSRETAILELEMLAVSVSSLWHLLLSSKSVAIFSDNDPVKSSVSNCYSQNRHVDQLMGELFRLEDE